MPRYTDKKPGAGRTGDRSHARPASGGKPRFGGKPSFSGKPSGRPVRGAASTGFAHRQDNWTREPARPAETRMAEVPPIEEADGPLTLEGRHAVLEALKAGRPMDKLYILRGGEEGSLPMLRAKAIDAGIPVVECDRRKLDEMSVTGVHQGVIAAIPAKEYATIDQLFEAAEAAGEPPLFILCDNLSDPHNLGAIIRTAGAVGAHGVIIPRHRSVGLTAITAKAAAGALEYVPVCRCANMSAAIRELKDRGVWIFGTAAEGETSLYDADFRRACAIVIGAEGPGMSRVVRDACDYTVTIPMRGQVPSLNASAAAAVVLFEAMRRRMDV